MSEREQQLLISWREHFPDIDILTSNEEFHSWAQSLDRPNQIRLANELTDWTMELMGVPEEIRRGLDDTTVEQEKAQREFFGLIENKFLKEDQRKEGVSSFADSLGVPERWYWFYQKSVRLHDMELGLLDQSIIFIFDGNEDLEKQVRGLIDIIGAERLEELLKTGPHAVTVDSKTLEAYHKWRESPNFQRFFGDSLPQLD